MKTTCTSKSAGDGSDWKGYVPRMLFAGTAVVLVVVVTAVSAYLIHRTPRPARADENTVLKHLEKEYAAKYKLDDKGNVFRVELEGPRVDDDAIEYVVKLKKLKELSLWKSSVTDAGIDKLRELRWLEHLGLMDTRVSDAGLKHLENMPALRDVWVRENKRLTRQGVASLKIALPGLKVHGVK